MKIVGMRKTVAIFICSVYLFRLYLLKSLTVVPQEATKGRILDGEVVRVDTGALEVSGSDNNNSLPASPAARSPDRHLRPRRIPLPGMDTNIFFSFQFEIYVHTYIYMFINTYTSCVRSLRPIQFIPVCADVLDLYKKCGLKGQHCCFVLADSRTGRVPKF